ncbi:Bug family tripartite tricarboxylate transporter substrate binding protein [Bordetella sp. 2513F-2]
MHRRCVLKTLAALPVLGAAPLLRAQPQAYPARPVKIVVPFPAGNAVDLVARLAGEALSERYKQSFVVDNRPGAKGIIGIRHASEQPADGYTLVGGGLGNVLPIATLRNLPIDIAQVLVPIAQVAEFANVFIVRADSAFASIADVVAYMGRNPPGHLTVGAGDVGSSAHMAAMLFADRTRSQVTSVPYRGQNEIVVHLVGGQLDVGISSVPASLAMLRSGRVRALAVTSRQRSALLPEVPTMEESGVPDYNVSSWLGLYGTHGTPQAILDQLGRDLPAALATDANRAKLVSAGLDPSILGPEAFAAVNRAEIERWSQFARQIGAVSDYS